MKYISLFALLICLCLAVGCAPANVTPTDLSSVSSQPQPQPKEVTMDLAYERYWTWNDLYDYLESPLQSGELSFDADEQTLFLFAADGKTKITRWDAPLEDGMVARLYDANGLVVRQIVLHITNLPPELTQSDASAQPLPDASQTTSQDGGSQEKTVITLRGGANKALKKAVDAFNKQSKTVLVELTDADELYSAAGLMRESNTQLCPDVVLLDYSQYHVASRRGLLTSLSVADQKPFGLSATETAYGVLLGKEAFCTAANLDVLYDCDVELPESSDDMLAVARKVKSVFPDTTPLGLVTDSSDPATVGMVFSDWLNANGGRLLTPDCDAAALYSESGVRTISAYQTYYKEGLIATHYTAEEFTNGVTAFGRVSSKQYEQIFGKLARHNYKPMPLLLPNQAGGTVQSYYYCIPQNNNQAELAAAYEFLTFLLGDVDTLTALCKTAGLVPAHPQVRENKYYRTQAWQILMDEADRGYDPLLLNCTDTLYGYVTEGVLAVLQGEDPELTLERLKLLTERRLARLS